jgi:RNA-directed DNA polymerase
MSNSKAHLFERLANPRELEHAWLDVLAHYPQDRVPQELRAFERKREGEIQRLAAALRARTFFPEPASLIFVPKPNHPDERRRITLIRPEDRTVLTALNRLLSPIFDRQFRPQSYAYRPGKGAWSAVERVTKCLRNGLIHIASGDIDDFFTNIDRGRLLRDVARAIFERPILDLLETYLHMEAARDFEWIDTGRGVAQGSPLSPLLSNIALAGFDRSLDDCGVEWVRYADNFILLAADAAQARDAFARAEAFLMENCGLALNAARTFASEADGFEFLGFWFRDGRRTITPWKLDQKHLQAARSSKVAMTADPPQDHQTNMPSSIWISVSSTMRLPVSVFSKESGGRPSRRGCGLRNHTSARSRLP